MPKLIEAYILALKYSKQTSFDAFWILPNIQMLRNIHILRTDIFVYCQISYTAKYHVLPNIGIIEQCTIYFAVHSGLLKRSKNS